MSFIGLIIIFAFYGALFLYAIAEYVLNSLGLYGIAKKRGISLPGLAWLPVGNLWVLGSFVNSYEEKKEDHFKKWHILLPVLMGVMIAAYVLFYVVYFVFYFLLFGAAMMNAEADLEFSGIAIVFLVVVFAMAIIISLAAVLLQAFSSIALYKAYESISPKKAIKYLIISIVVPLGQGICLIKCKKLIPDPTPFDDVNADAPVSGYQFDEPVALDIKPQDAVVNNENTIDPENLV